MWIAQTAPFRYVAAPGKCGATPPPACGALWRMAQLGKCARATPRQPAGRLARGSANLGLSLTSRKSALCPTGGVQNALFRDPNLPECAFPSRRDRRMRFSVRARTQSASFRRMRFSSPAQTSSHLTEKRTLAPAPHAQAHSAARSGPPPRLSGPATSRIRRLCRCAGSIPLQPCCLWGRSQVWNQASFSTCGCAPAPHC